MNKRLTQLSLAAAAIGAGALLIPSSHAAGAAAASGDLHTTAKLIYAHHVDLPPRGPSSADITTFGGRLLGPDLTGRYQAYCVNVSAARQECSETLILPDGQIAAQAAYGQSTRALTPIVGGSGKYATARGDFSEQEIANGREVKLILHLQS